MRETIKEKAAERAEDSLGLSVEEVNFITRELEDEMNKQIASLHSEYERPTGSCYTQQEHAEAIAKAKGQENNTLAEDVPELVGLEQGIQTNGRAPTGMEAATENLQQVNDDAGQGQEELPDKEAVNVDQGADDGAMDLDADQDAQGGASAEGE